LGVESFVVLPDSTPSVDDAGELCAAADESFVASAAAPASAVDSAEVAVLAGVLAAVLPVVSGDRRRRWRHRSGRPSTAADACGAVALAIFWRTCSNAAMRPPVPTTMLPFGSMRTEQPAGFDDDPREARQRCQVGPVATIEQAIHDRRGGAEKRAHNCCRVARADGAEHVLDPMIGLCENVANV
jgi:hypothetical protein